MPGKARRLLLACDKDVFSDMDFVRQNPMLVKNGDKRSVKEMRYKHVPIF